MKQADTSYIVVGKIGSPYGVRGWLKIQSYTEFGAGILDLKHWYTQSANNEWAEIKVDEKKIHGKYVIAKFTGIDSPEEARLLTGKIIGVIRSQLPTLKKDEYYWSDLVGLKVVHKDGEILGKVIYLLATGSNDVLVIKNEKEHAIPFLLGDVILSVDLEKQEIVVDWELI